MTTSTLATMEWAMWRMAASGEYELHFQPSTDEMSQLAGEHVEAVHYECTCFPNTSVRLCLRSEIRISGTETNMSSLLHKQTCPVNTLYGHTIPALNYRAQESHSPAFREQTRFYEFYTVLSWSPAKFGPGCQMSRISPSHKNNTNFWQLIRIF